MRRAGVTILPFLCFFLGAQAFAQDTGTIGGGKLIEPLDGSADQQINGVTQVSGQSVLGIVLGGPGTTKSSAGNGPQRLPNSIYLYRPRPNSAVCLQLGSIDGRVISSGIYKLGPVTGDFVALAVQPAPALAGYAPEEIVIRATYQADCKGPDGVPALAVAHPSSDADIGLAINPGTDMNAYYFRKSGDSGLRINCDATTSSRSVLFTSICWASIAEFTSAAGFSIHTENREGEGPPIQYSFTSSRSGR